MRHPGTIELVTRLCFTGSGRLRHFVPLVGELDGCSADARTA